MGEMIGKFGGLLKKTTNVGGLFGLALSPGTNVCARELSFEKNIISGLKIQRLPVIVQSDIGFVRPKTCFSRKRVFEKK